MEIRPLTELHADSYWRLRLEALEHVPSAFAEDAAEHRASSVESASVRLRSSSPEDFVLGAFVDGELAGMIGFTRYKALKTKHKGRIWGVYVRENQRKQGIAFRLVAEVIERVRLLPGLERLTLSVGTGQKEAQRLYLRAGFEIYGGEKHALKVGETHVDEDHMVLLLRTI